MTGLFLFSTASGAHPASYPVGTGVKGPGHGADHLPADFNNAWSFTSTPQYVFTA